VTPFAQRPSGFAARLDARATAAQDGHRPTETPHPDERQDGFTNDSPVFAWQAEVERGPNPNYPALRATLLWARTHPAATLADLRDYYQRAN
jgi:hypothetical protein